MVGALNAKVRQLELDNSEPIKMVLHVKHRHEVDQVVSCRE